MVNQEQILKPIQRVSHEFYHRINQTDCLIINFFFFMNNCLIINNQDIYVICHMHMKPRMLKTLKVVHNCNI
jgi:hypothetical protein